jgi:polyketide cyclase/dehydrase/lipid transport protein
MLKKVVIALAAIVVIFVIVVVFQPADFRVERTTTIAAPQADVFAKVNDFHKWDAWSPWAKLDPDATITFDGPQSVQGTVMTWAGNNRVGEGKMTLTESQPNDLVKLKVDFVKPFEGTARQEFALKPQGDQTAVTWSMQGHNNSFIQKAFCLVMNGKKMIGGDLEKGLAQLKSVSETGKAASNN